LWIRSKITINGLFYVEKGRYSKTGKQDELKFPWSVEILTLFPLPSLSFPAILAI
jgi:hypothetical protein